MTVTQVPAAERVAANDGFVLDAQLCFALHAASRAMTGSYRPLLDELGLTYSQYVVMLVLWEQESITLGEIGRQLQLDSGTLSPLLRRLDERGLLTRVRRVEDERTVQVTITDAGRVLRPRASKAQQSVVRATGYTPTELAELRDALHALTAKLRGTIA